MSRASKPQLKITKMYVPSLVCVLLLCALCCGQDVTTVTPSVNLHHGLTQRIGNFSIELLYLTTAQQEKTTNLIMSPVTAWTLLAVVAEGASGNTLTEICKTLRIVPKKRVEFRTEFRNIFQYLQVKTNTVILERLNTIFVDEKTYLLRDFVGVAAQYDTKMVTANFSNAERTADVINEAISTVTHGRINSIISSDDLLNSRMIMTSTLYFKGQWTYPFNASMTRVQPFYSSTGAQIGEVNMMYNRRIYPYANIKPLQARVLEIPYGKENRLSMLIMLPNPGVSLKDMFINFNKLSLDSIFNELRISTEEYGDDEVDCFIPRFKIESKLDLTDTLKLMGIVDMFEESTARLELLSRTPLYVTKVVHKAEIEVTEEGTTASAVTAAEFTNRISVIRFEANRPFCYLIIEKTTNTIAFGGFYHLPSLY